ncbi:hypothetical protein [Thermomonas flagellata]|uniref:hypothetical protein n=1 Tax=Thermomonas flagellata TaxID=2888524 RepID=UPI001F046E61|nr:hypothetical protein [Thermomonas flagellata]
MGARLLAPGLLPGALVPAAAVERQALESRLVVAGEITLGPDGAIREYRPDPKAPIGQDVRGFLDGSIRGWQFELVREAGEPVDVRAPMRQRLASAWFGDPKGGDGAGPCRMPAPIYPEDALRFGYAGNVYLLLRVDANGIPQDAATEQVDLYTVGNERLMQQIRRVLAAGRVVRARPRSAHRPGAGRFHPGWGGLLRARPAAYLPARAAQPRHPVGTGSPAGGRRPGRGAAQRDQPAGGRRAASAHPGRGLTPALPPWPASGRPC